MNGNGAYSRLNFVLLAIQVVLFLGTAILLVFLVNQLILVQASALNVFTVDVPQKIVNGYEFHPGSIVKVQTRKCNLSERSISVDGITLLTRQAPSRVNLKTNETYGVVWGARECREGIFENKLPDDLSLGKWRYEGTNTVHAEGREQIVPWYTEWFVVTP